MSKLYLKFVDKFYKQLDIVEKSLVKEDKTPLFKPFITISRDPGSGGKPIAEKVAAKLGHEFYDDKLIEEVAKSAKLTKEVLSKVDEKSRQVVSDLVHHMINPDYVSESQYLQHLCKVLLTLSQKEQAVFLGRGSNYILPKKYGLRVRITAPYRVCVARAVQHEDVSYDKAREIIRDVTEERERFVKQYFGKDIGSSKYYDLTINTHYMSIDDAVEVICTAFKKRFGN